jgi:hypothetical protein
MRKHTQAEVDRMADLVRDELVKLLISIGQRSTKSKVLANTIIKENLENLNNILDMPHGGALSPDELAEMVLSQYVYKRQGLYDEEAAAALMA